MKAKEYAELLGVPHGTVKRWLLEGLPAERGGRSNAVRIDASAANAWVNTHKAASITFERGCSVVYFARREDGAIKIGWTSDVPRRLLEIRKECGANVVLLAAIPGDKPDELALHERFGAHRLRGEWFVPAAAIASFLDSIKRAA